MATAGMLLSSGIPSFPRRWLQIWWWWLAAAGSSAVVASRLAGPVVIFFLFCFICSACQDEAHSKDLTLCRASPS